MKGYLAGNRGPDGPVRSGQEEVAVIVHGHPAGAVQLAVDGQPAVTAAADGTGTGHPGDDVGFAVDPANCLVTQIREV